MLLLQHGQVGQTRVGALGAIRTRWRARGVVAINKRPELGTNLLYYLAALIKHIARISRLLLVMVLGWWQRQTRIKLMATFANRVAARQAAAQQSRAR